MSRSAKALKSEVYEPPRTRAPQQSRAVTVEAPAYPATLGPAKVIQSHLADTLMAEADSKWSARKLLAFLLVTCGGFWLVVGLVARRMF